MAVARTQEEIDEQLEKALPTSPSRWPGMTYEEGVEAALLWVTGHSDDAPVEDE